MLRVKVQGFVITPPFWWVKSRRGGTFCLVNCRGLVGPLRGYREEFRAGPNPKALKPQNPKTSNHKP